MRRTITLSRSFLRHHSTSPPLTVAARRPFHSSASAPPPPFSNLHYARDFISLIKTLSCSPNNPRLLAALDSLLTSAHLLDSATSLIVLRGLALTKKLTRAKSLLSSLAAAVPAPFSYSVVLQCLLPFAPARDVETVWAEVSPSSINFSHFITHLCRHGGHASEIKSAYLRASSSGWGLTRRAYTALIGGMCGNESPNPSLARAVLREMEERGFEADEFAYFVVFRSFCQAGELSKADSVLRNMVERKSYELDVLVLENFLHGLCKSGKFREARKMFDKLTKRSGRRGDTTASVLKPGRRTIFQLIPPDTLSAETVFVAYFRSLCSAENVDEAERLLKEATEKNDVHDVCVYSTFVEALFRVGRADDAMRFFESERKKDQFAAWEIATVVVAGLCEMGRVDDGCRLLRETVDSGFAPTAWVWNYILQGYWNDGRVDDVMRLFKEMRPDTSTYTVMINGFLRNGDIEMTSSLIRDASGKKIRLDAMLHGAVARALQEHKGLEEAHRYLNQMIENGILVSYTAWELLFDSMIMDSGDDSFSYGISLSLDCTDGNSQRSGKHERS